MFSLEKNAQVSVHLKTHWGVYPLPQVGKKKNLSLTSFFWLVQVNCSIDTDILSLAESGTELNPEVLLGWSMYYFIAINF